MIEVDEDRWTEKGLAWQKDGDAYRFLVPGRTEAPAVLIRKNLKTGEPILSGGGKQLLDLQTSRSSSHKALQAYLDAALAA